jgi:hypothetical protein
MEWLARASSARRDFIDMPYSSNRKTLDRDRHFALFFVRICLELFYNILFYLCYDSVYKFPHYLGDYFESFFPGLLRASSVIPTGTR